MIQVSHIRIGNYISMVGDYHGNPEKQYWDIVVAQASTITSASLFPDSYKGIPLSDEWLKKLGFLFDGARWNCQKGAGAENWKMAIYNIENVFRWQSDMFLHVKLTYVHELQNLYFALTGQELKIIS